MGWYELGFSGDHQFSIGCTPDLGPSVNTGSKEIFDQLTPDFQPDLAIFQQASTGE